MSLENELVSTNKNENLSPGVQIMQLNIVCNII